MKFDFELQINYKLVDFLILQPILHNKYFLFLLFFLIHWFIKIYLSLINVLFNKISIKEKRSIKFVLI